MSKNGTAKKNATTRTRTSVNKSPELIKLEKNLALNNRDLHIVLKGILDALKDHKLADKKFIKSAYALIENPCERDPPGC